VLFRSASVFAMAEALSGGDLYAVR
jgi:hypothetical protein